VYDNVQQLVLSETFKNFRYTSALDDALMQHTMPRDFAF